MTMAAYVQRQKDIIRDRHVGEEHFIICGQEVPVKTREQLFVELEEMKGLNKTERDTCVRRRFQRA